MGCNCLQAQEGHVQKFQKEGCITKQSPPCSSAVDSKPVQRTKSCSKYKQTAAVAKSLRSSSCHSQIQQSTQVCFDNIDGSWLASAIYVFMSPQLSSTVKRIDRNGGKWTSKAWRHNEPRVYTHLSTVVQTTLLFRTGET